MELLSIHPPPPMNKAAGMSSPEQSMSACSTHFGMKQEMVVCGQEMHFQQPCSRWLPQAS